MKHLYSILILLFIPILTNGQWGLLDKPELSTVEYNGIVYTGSAVLIINDGGVFRSTDNGISWSMSVSGLDTAQVGAYSITSIGAPRNEVWLSSSGSLYKSTNHGATWTKSELSGLPVGAWPDKIGRTGTRLFTILSYWDNDLLKNVNRLAYSTDGITWNLGYTLALDGSSWWEFLDEDNDRALFLVEYPNDGSSEKIWMTTTGNTIQELPLTGLPVDADINRRSFSIEPEGNNLLFSNGNEGAYYLFNFGTQTWEKKINGISLPDHTIAMAFGGHSLSGLMLTTVLFADAEMNLVMKLFSSTDNGNTWTLIENPGFTYPMFEGKMITAGSNRIIGGYFNSNLAYSDNSGQTWAKVTAIQAGDFRSLRALANGTLVAASMEQTKGLIKSTDNGETWVTTNGNLVNFQGIYLIEDIRAAGNYLYVISAEDPFSEKPYLFISTDIEGGLFTKLTSAPDSAEMSFAGMHGMWPVFLFKDKEGNGTWQMTKDAGTSWINLTPAIASLSLDRVFSFKGNGTGGMLFLVGEKNFKTRIYLSKNDGASFYDITSNLDGFNFEILLANQWDWDETTNVMASFRADNKFLLAAMDNTIPPGEMRFFMLDEIEELWVKQGTSGIPRDYQANLNSLRFNSGVWYFVSSTAAYASINNCATWLPVWNNEGFPVGTRPGSFVMNSYGAYLGTRGAGVWRAPLTAPIITTLAATEITDTTAASGATIVSTGGLPFGNKGLCWSMFPGPTVSDNVIWVGNSWDSFTDTLRMLAPNTDYYVRAAVWSPKGGGQPVYGNEISFRTDNTTRIFSEESGELLVYPNPSDGRFTVTAESEWIMTVMDLQGRIIMTEKVTPGANQIRMQKTTPGFYFLRLTDKSNSSQTIRMIVK
ncbi:MAG: T9SS type A sorting domain-containing protein [Bacteroidales bacterium]|nr:T9SS type A sorting domain-containing protein [Bacteroidales bacterium]